MGIQEERSGTRLDVGGQGATLELSEVGALSCLELRRSFSGELLLQVGSRAIGIGTMADHGGSKVGVRCEGLRPKVVEHGVGAPPSKDLGSSGVNASTQERGSTTWAEAFDG